MEKEECLQIYKDNLLEIIDADSESAGNYELCGYSFHGLFVDLVISYHKDKEFDEPYSFCLYVYCDSNTNNCEKDLLLFTQIFVSNSIETNVMEILKFLMYEFRQSFTYSKLLDEIIRVETMIIAEKRKMARILLVEDGKIEKCCVCYDYNYIYTSCGHYLCRICMVSMISNVKGNDILKCPMCRVEL